VIESGQSIAMMAGTTAAIGMGVVFASLFLLSVYMHYFKIFIARVEARHKASQPAAQKSAPPAAPQLTPAPGGAPTAHAAAPVAAAIAVGLRLHGVGGAPSGEVAAAIATALSLQRGRARAALQPRPGAAPWQMSGRLEMMGARVRRQER
jgi:Na+-transporting methylmalonyl-CoA/oxaloacetate decarboxylase gamma subunit